MRKVLQAFNCWAIFWLCFYFQRQAAEFAKAEVSLYAVILCCHYSFLLHLTFFNWGGFLYICFHFFIFLSLFLALLLLSFHLILLFFFRFLWSWTRQDVLRHLMQTLSKGKHSVESPSLTHYPAVKSFVLWLTTANTIVP